MPFCLKLGEIFVDILYRTWSKVLKNYLYILIYLYNHIRVKKITKYALTSSTGQCGLKRMFYFGESINVGPKKYFGLPT